MLSPSARPSGGSGFWGGGGEQLRAGTMFLATLYFALPLLGKSRLPLAFFTAASFRGVHGSPPKIAQERWA